jgi:hypothetical protein
MTHDWTKAAESTAQAALALAVTLDRFGYADLAKKMEKSMTWARNQVRAWLDAGIIEQLPNVEGEAWQWRVTDSAKARLVIAVKTRSPEQNMWTAMRQLKSFSPRELAAHATTETTSVTLEMAQDYCRSLLGAGYLTVVKKAIPGSRLAIYRLVKNTGPRPPRAKRVRAVVDDNTETVTVIGGGQ